MSFKRKKRRRAQVFNATGLKNCTAYALESSCLQVSQFYQAAFCGELQVAGHEDVFCQEAASGEEHVMVRIIFQRKVFFLQLHRLLQPMGQYFCNIPIALLCQVQPAALHGQQSWQNPTMQVQRTEFWIKLWHSILKNQKSFVFMFAAFLAHRVS